MTRREEKESNNPQAHKDKTSNQHILATHKLYNATKTKTPAVPPPPAIHHARHAASNAATYKKTGKQR
jgi:hypothetical protein